MINYRLSYRLSIASAGSNTYNQLHGSSIVRKKKSKKENESTYQQLSDDAATTAYLCPMWNNGFFVYPPILLEIFADCISSDNRFLSAAVVSDLVKTPLRSVILNGQEYRTYNDINEEREFTMSLRTKAKIKDKMYSLYRSRMRNYTFCTLSFINKVDDKVSVQVLNKFFTQLRKKYPDFHYIWIAERQDGKRNDYEHCTDNVHFHIFFDRFFPIAKLNAYWVLMQYNSGITHSKYTKAEILQMYRNGKLQKALNPVDIKHIKGLSGLTSYMTKYVTKNETTFGCRVWHCSRGISRLFTSAAVDRTVFRNTGCCSLNSVVDKSTGEVFERKTFVTDYAIVHTIVNKRHFSTYLKQMEFINAQILDGVKFKTEDFLLDHNVALQTSLS